MIYLFMLKQIMNILNYYIVLDSRWCNEFIKYILDSIINTSIMITLHQRTDYFYVLQVVTQRGVINGVSNHQTIYLLIPQFMFIASRKLVAIYFMVFIIQDMLGNISCIINLYITILTRPRPAFKCITALFGFFHKLSNLNS